MKKPKVDVRKSKREMKGELERIIHRWWKESCLPFITVSQIQYLAQAVLDAGYHKDTRSPTTKEYKKLMEEFLRNVCEHYGKRFGYVKLKDVRIDEGKLVNMLCSYIVEKNIRIYTMCSDKKEVPLDILRDLTKAIAKDKPIMGRED